MRNNIAQILAAACFLLSIESCITRQNTFGVVGKPAISNDGNYITCIVAESEGITHQENGGYRKTNYSTSYWLKLYETATGKLSQKKKLVPSDASGNVDISCFGCFDNKIWLYVNGIRAYDMNSLEEVNSEEKIAAANGMKKTIFPYDERLVYAAVEKGYIDFIADNGEEYRLLLKELKIINRKEIKDAGTEKRNIDLHRDDDYGTQCDTLGSQVFAFAKNKAAANEARPGLYRLEESGYRMTLFKGGYTLEPLGDHFSFSYQNMAPAGSDTYLNPCFAADTYTGHIIHLSNPDGYIIIHQDVSGEKSKALITRIDTNGKVVWEKQTGVSTKIDHCILQGKYVFISANKEYMFSPFIGKDALCIIDTTSGNIIQPSLKD